MSICFIVDEETIPDATDALTSNRVTALIASDKDLEEGSSSHDGPESMKLNGDDLPGNNINSNDEMKLTYSCPFFLPSLSQYLEMEPWLRQ